MTDAGPIVAPERVRLVAAAAPAVVAGVAIALGSRRAALDQVPARHQLDALAYGLIAFAAAGLIFRRSSPLTALAVGTAACAAYLWFQYPYGPIFVVVAWPLVMVALRLPVRWSVIACAVAMASLVAVELASIARSGGASGWLGTLAWPTWLLVPWAVGTVVRFKREAVVRGRAENANRHAYEERLRIAREVHDVVGHALAVINMQAGVALHVVDKRPEQAEVALEAIKRTSKDALEDLRVTLAVYRQDPDAPRRPAPGLDQLDGLIEATVASGVRVELTVAGERPDVPAAVDLAAYRIVQESLTNVIRHAGLASATVRVRYEPAAVVVEVLDDGRSRPGDVPRAGGHGISGMRERVAAVGGTLEAGPRAEGGFAVRARLPVAHQGAAPVTEPVT